ncbi:toxin-antitoxin system YwqK family antitoxin [Myroides odoratimimus]|uniref:toxin-antitoxin system YwqK family antitoxin n=1 Tax=Myroides odoratimimus TaxID=76832 RepID=UPI00056BC3DA|nr:hypothetical protein [Myroides odoratimimus]
MKNIVSVIVSLLLLGNVCYGQERKILLKDMKNELYQDQQLWYEIKSKKLFTGKVVGDGVEIGENSYSYYKNGLPEGKFEIHTLEGKLKIEGNVKQGMLDGRIKEYYSSGILKREGIYENSVLIGGEIVYHENGLVMYKFNNEQKQPLEEYDYTGNLIQENKECKGTSCKVIKKYWRNGNVKMIENDEGLEGGTTKLYYFENGELRRDLFYPGYRGSNRDLQYFENGNLRANYVDARTQNKEIVLKYSEYGLLEKAYRTDNPDEYLKLDPKLLGKKISMVKISNEKSMMQNDTIILSDFLDKDILDGKWRLTYPNKQLFCEYSFKKGQPIDGTFTMYYETGKIHKETVLKDMGKTSIIREYYNSGELLKEYTISNGTFDEMYKEYAKNGVLLIEGVYKKGRRIGEYKKYYNDGKLSSIIRYDKENYYDERLTVYYKDGNVAIEAESFDFIKKYSVKYFDMKGNIISDSILRDEYPGFNERNEDEESDE